MEVKERKTTANTKIFVPKVADLKGAEKVMIRSAQRKAFSEEIDVLQHLSDKPKLIKKPPRVIQR